MKASTPELRALLASGDYVMADLWTITLSGGQVIRWSGADRAVRNGGHTFARGPLVTGGGISEKTGLEVSTLTMKIDAAAEELDAAGNVIRPADLINGVGVIKFIANRGLDGANVKLERAFAPTWDDLGPTTIDATGTVLRFSGRVTSVGNIQGTHAEVTVSSWLILLNVQMPANLYQVGCLHTVYDSGCGLNPNSFKLTGTVSGTPTQLAFASGVTGHSGEFAQGRVVFTSGANAGLARTVKSNDGSGNFTLIQALPTAPSAGDTFTAYKGCDNSKGTCDARFNNLGRFKAAPFTPTPETTLGV